MTFKLITFLTLYFVFTANLLQAQSSCWNDKKVPKEWFVIALGGYTFGLGERPYWNRDKNNLVSDKKFDVYYLNNARGWIVNVGLGVYLNKNLGVQLLVNYLMGNNYKGTASEVYAFGESWYSNNENIQMDSYSAKSIYAYRVRTWSVVPCLLYKFHFKKMYAFALLGLGVAITKDISSTSTTKQFFLNQNVVKEISYQNSINAWKKDEYILGIYSGLGLAYPINGKLEIIGQTIMKTQQLMGVSGEENDLYVPSYPLDGLEISIGIKYNLFTSRLDAK